MSTIQDEGVVYSSGKNKAAIEVRELVKCYKKSSVNAVDGISFSMQQGEVFGLLGPNGAGKTTTIGILTTGMLPTSGSTSIMGQDVVRDPISVKQLIAVVPQRSNLDQSLCVRDILIFHAAYHGVPRAERETRADALLTELGLADRSKDIVGRYSGGMGQRLMIARALMHSPEILFLDEPTNSLDPQSRLFIWDTIHSLNKQGLSILITTHDMEEADQLCDRIAIMDHGHILVLNTPAELKKMIPGGATLDLHVHIPELVSDSRGGSTHVGQDILDALRALPHVTKVKEVSSAGQQGILHFCLYAQDAEALVGGATQTILAAGAELRDLHLARPSLENVFIYLTGRKLRI